MLLKRETFDDDLVTYIVVSLDFGPEDEWKPIGRLKIAKGQRCFEFEPLNEWLDMGIAISQQDNRSISEMADANENWLRWRYRIREWAVHLIERDFYPEIYPE